MLVTGRMFPVHKELVIVGKVIGVETSRVYGHTVSMPAKGSLVEASSELAMELGKVIREHGETLVARVEDKSTVVERLREQVAGRALPSVSVSIPEQSIGEVVLDPAAETEISFILQQLGFEIIDPLATNRPADVEVTGEAFSEFGLRKGNLVSSKARVEIKALARASGEVVLVDRESTVAVDLGAESAGKAALAKGAAKLTERLVPAILEAMAE